MALTSPLPNIAPAATETSLTSFRAGVSAYREPLLKRHLDVVLALLMLLVSAPVWLLIAIAIKLDDGGPIFYRQERWGRNQNAFRVLKFRSMVASSDQLFGVRQATQNDHRVTRVGGMLRATGLDELPQLINILRGEMSFVGPRALATDERNAFGLPIRYDEMPGFSTRLLVRPGLTGLATIYLPKDATAHRKFRTDLLYVRRSCFWLDVQLIGLSFWISFRGRWETRSKKL